MMDFLKVMVQGRLLGEWINSCVQFGLKEEFPPRLRVTIIMRMSNVLSVI